MCLKLQLFNGKTKTKIHGVEFFYQTMLSKCIPQDWNSAITKQIKGKNLQPESRMHILALLLRKFGNLGKFMKSPVSSLG